MKPVIAFLLVISPFAGSAFPGDERAAGGLRDGDRVVLLGGGFVEQERLHGYLETRLLRHHPGGRLSFRNLGWAGDTVRGAARTGGFENPEGMARLLREVSHCKPTVIFVGYGMNESFAGADGVAPFVKDYAALLDRLAATKARLILLSPTYHEPLGPPHPDATEHNGHLASYGEAVRGLARDRGLEFIDLFGALKKAKEAEPGRVFTTNGIQPNAAGYAVIARTVEAALGYPAEWRVTVSAAGGVKESVGARVEAERTRRGLRLSVRGAAPAVADSLGEGAFFLKVTDLPAGPHGLEIGGKLAARATAGEWQEGVRVRDVAETGEKLRRAVVARNELFYRRWRPFNDHERHFGFLKGDFALYDKAIAEQERAIAALLAPRSCSIEIVPLGK